MTSPAPLPSERKFGFLFVAVFAAIGGYGQFKGWSASAAAAWLAASVLVGVITLAAPRLLAPFNRAWFELGQLLGKFVSPVVLLLIFFVLITPVALLARLAGRDALRLKPSQGSSYWIDREPPGPPPESFKNQY